MKYEIIPIDFLKPLEKVFPTHLNNLELMIDSDGYLQKPIIADKNSGVIADGSHRYVYLLKHGYKEVPVVFIDYSDDNIRVGNHLCHRLYINGDCNISKAECVRRALGGDLFPPRTTRHFFTFRKDDIMLPLAQLKKGIPVDVTHLIANVDISEEIEHNTKYISEINEELNVIIQYLEEVSQTKTYLLKQVELMNVNRKVAFFPGKFHPPHVGQIQTILNIIPKYKKVIIGVSEHMPEDGALTTPNDILLTLRGLFKHFKNVEVCLIKGVLVDKKDTDGLPEFDVLLSGNEDVLSWAKTHDVMAEFIDRSCGDLCSGTNVRGILKN
jgi:hypothetical protein